MIKGGLCLRRWGWLLLIALSAVACSAASPSPNPVDTLPLQPTERRSFDPGGSTVITQWAAQGESLPRVVQATGYRSGMRLIDGVSLVFHIKQQRWLLMLSGQPTDFLETAPSGERLRLVQPVVDSPMLWRARFSRLGHEWSLTVTGVQTPPPEIPRVSTEGQHALELLLVRDSAKPENENR